MRPGRDSLLWFLTPGPGLSIKVLGGGYSLTGIGFDEQGNLHDIVCARMIDRACQANAQFGQGICLTEFIIGRTDHEEGAVSEEQADGVGRTLVELFDDRDGLDDTKCANGVRQ